MSSIKFNHSNADGRQTISVFLVKDDGETVEKIVTQATPGFAQLITYLATNENPDVEFVHGLVDPSVGIGRLLQEEFGERVTFDLHHFYLDGIPETSLLSRVVKDKVLNGDADWKRLVRFMVRLDANPSKRAKDAIWAWVEKHGVSITEDGRIAGFKGLVTGTDEVTGETGVPVSYHKGPNNFIDGVLYGEAGTAYQVPHRVGTVISKRRGDVDDNTKLACSTGLHVGAYSYAKTFGENRSDGQRYSTMGKMASTFAIVVFAPEDVVSVPEDYSADWKIRVTKYEVSEFLETVEDVLKDKPIYDTPTPAPFLSRSEPFQAEPEVERPVEEPEVEDESTEGAWTVVEYDNLGTTVLETFDTKEAADEAYSGYVDDEPDGDFNVLGPDEDEADVETEEQVTQQPSADLTLAENAALLPDLKADLEDPSKGHKRVGRDWSNLTSEASVRRYRKAKGISINLKARVTG